MFLPAVIITAQESERLVSDQYLSTPTCSVEFMAGTTVVYNNLGKVVSGTPTKDVTVNVGSTTVCVQGGESFELHESGSLSSGVLCETHCRNSHNPKDCYQAGTRAKFGPSGTLISGILTDDADFSSSSTGPRVTFRANTCVNFYSHGRVKSGVLAENIYLEDRGLIVPLSASTRKFGDTGRYRIEFKRGTSIKFYSNIRSYLASGTLAEDQYLTSPYGANRALFQEGSGVEFAISGGVIKGVLAKESYLENGDCRSQFAADSAVHFDRKGRVVKGTLCQDTYLPTLNSRAKFDRGTTVQLDEQGRVIDWYK